MAMASGETSSLPVSMGINPRPMWVQFYALAPLVGPVNEPMPPYPFGEYRREIILHMYVTLPDQRRRLLKVDHTLTVSDTLSISFKDFSPEEGTQAASSGAWSTRNMIGASDLQTSRNSSKFVEAVLQNVLALSTLW